MQILLWLVYAVVAVNCVTVTTTATLRSTIALTTKTSTVVSTKVSTSIQTSTVALTTKTSTVVSTKLSTLTSTATAISTKLSTITSTATATKLSTITAPASTVYVSLPASTSTLLASTVTSISVSTLSTTATLPASTLTLPASTLTLPASTVTSISVSTLSTTATLPASTLTLPTSIVTSISVSTLSTTTTLPASTTTLSASISYITLSASTVTIPASTITLSASVSYVTLAASTVTITSSSSTSTTSGTSTNLSSTSSLITKSTVAAPTTTPSGTVSPCYQWHVANSWDTCVLIQGEFGISNSNFLAWNTNINSACSNIIAGDAYCVDGAGNIFTSPTATAPNAVVTGIASPCYRYHTWTSSDSCALVQLEFGISFDVLRAWNPSIDNGCDNCVVGDSYCVDGAGHSALPSTVSPPTPTGSGTTSTCYQYHTIASSDTCTSIESTFGLTFDLFRLWNTQINNYCSNLVQSYSYCVDGSGLFTNSSSQSSTSSSSTSATSTVSSSTSTATSSSTGTSIPPTSTGRAVFAHYMVGGITSAEAIIDVQQAQAMGIDAFALNVNTVLDSWCLNATAALFSAADDAGFELFFSFDMSYFSGPADFLPLLQAYITHPAYYRYKGLPFVSTFNGGSISNTIWQTSLKNALGTSIFFVPDFADISSPYSNAISPRNMYTSFPVVDGLFNWEGSWPTIAQGKVNVSSTDDVSYLSAAKSAGKKFMMGISPIQFKHMNSDSMNYVRRGGVSFALRIAQILTLQPDFVEIQTWNDALEGHYIGPVWNESIAASNMNYSLGYDHSGWQILMTPMLNAFKAGYTSINNVVPTGTDAVQGVFWHSTLLVSASCGGDPFGVPSGRSNIDDSVAVAILVAKGTSGLVVNVYSGTNKIGTYSNLVQGLNSFEVFGMGTGSVRVEVLSSAGTRLISGTGPRAVLADSTLCNYNPQVVALS